MERNLIHYTSLGWLIKFQKSTHEDYKIRCTFVTPDGKMSFGGNGNTMIDAFSAAELKAFSPLESAQRIELTKEEYQKLIDTCHRREIHPDYEYTSTIGDYLPGNGWEVNIHIKDNEPNRTYWMRKKQ